MEEEWQPELNFGTNGRIPEDYVPEPDICINLYARLAKLQDVDSIESFAQELDDRFGTLPDPVHQLLLIARSRRICRRLGIARVDAGPRGIALSFRAGAFLLQPKRWITPVWTPNGAMPNGAMTDRGAPVRR